MLQFILTLVSGPAGKILFFAGIAATVSVAGMVVDDLFCSQEKKTIKGNKKKNIFFMVLILMIL